MNSVVIWINITTSFQLHNKPENISLKTLLIGHFRVSIQIPFHFVNQQIL